MCDVVIDRYSSWTMDTRLHYVNQHCDSEWHWDSTVPEIKTWITIEDTKVNVAGIINLVVLKYCDGEDIEAALEAQKKALDAYNDLIKYDLDLIAKTVRESLEVPDMLLLNTVSLKPATNYSKLYPSNLNETYIVINIDFDIKK